MNVEFYKAYIRGYGHYYSGWYKRITFKQPVPYQGTTMITGVYCNEEGLDGRDCDPLVTLSNPIGTDYDFPLDKLPVNILEAVEGAMLEGDACTDTWE